MTKPQLRKLIKEKQNEIAELTKRLEVPDHAYDFSGLPTVADLRRAGIKVRVTEMRVETISFKIKNGMEVIKTQGAVVPKRYLKGDMFHNKGGKTTVEIKINDKEYFGIANCSFDDNFNRKFGVKLALSRALESLDEQGKKALNNLLHGQE